MPRAAVNGIELEYEILGEGEPLLLIMGLGAQLIHWPDDLCRRFIDLGFKLIRFDNRDCGRSSSIPETGRVAPWRLIGRALVGRSVPSAYRLADMADDAAGLLEHTGIERAHVLGVSLGGMIAQRLAIRHPARVKTLTAVMTSPGGRRWGLPRPRAMRALLGPRPRTAEEAGEAMVRLFRVIGSPGFYRDEDLVADIGRRSFERGANPAGLRRQLAAVLASGSCYRELRYLDVPALVIHGAEDPLIPPAAGRAIARAIPGARFELVPGMGHDLVAGVWPILVEGFAALAGAAAPTVRARADAGS